MPAEWEPHQGTILTWPHIPAGERDHPHWPGHYQRIPAIWARMVKELLVGEDVHIVIHDDETETIAKGEMEKANVSFDDSGRQGHRVHLHHIPNNFPWARDHGPIVVKNTEGERLFLDWQYNAWGGQWEYELDDRVPTLLAHELHEPVMDVPMVLEGGSIDVNGQGTLLTTEHCLLNSNRNPGLTKEQIERSLKDHLGVTKVLWLGEGIAGDDTSGHVDDLTRFVDPRTVVTIVNDDASDPDYAPLQENLRRLWSMTDQDGHSLEIIPITQPAPVTVAEQRVPASYANFYIANECVLLPVWNDPHDAAAIAVLQTCFPDRRIVPIDSRELTWGLGSFHCVTQQMPKS